MSDRIQNLLNAGKITPVEAKRRRQQRAISMGVSVPSRVSVKKKTPNPAVPVGMSAPVVVTRGEVVSVTYSEAYKVFHVGSGTIQKSALVVKPNSLPYLATSFGFYQRFRFRKAVLTWTPLSSSTDAGTIGLSPCNHIAQPTDISLVTVLNNPGGKGGPAGVGLTIPIPLKQYADDWFASDSDPLKAGTGGIEFMYWYQSSTLQPNGSPAGLVRISYVVEFTAPNMPPTGLHDDSPVVSTTSSRHSRSNSEHHESGSTNDQNAGKETGDSVTADIESFVSKATEEELNVLMKLLWDKRHITSKREDEEDTH